MTCNTCQNYQRGWCGKAQQAGLSTRPRAEVGSTIADMHQNCSAYKTK